MNNTIFSTFYHYIIRLYITAVLLYLSNMYKIYIILYFENQNASINKNLNN